MSPFLLPFGFISQGGGAGGGNQNALFDDASLYYKFNGNLDSDGTEGANTISSTVPITFTSGADIVGDAGVFEGVNKIGYTPSIKPILDDIKTVYLRARATKKGSIFAAHTSINSTNSDFDYNLVLNSGSSYFSTASLSFKDTTDTGRTLYLGQTIATSIWCNVLIEFDIGQTRVHLSKAGGAVEIYSINYGIQRTQSRFVFGNRIHYPSYYNVQGSAVIDRFATFPRLLSSAEITSLELDSVGAEP